MKLNWRTEINRRLYGTRGRGYQGIDYPRSLGRARGKLVLLKTSKHTPCPLECRAACAKFDLELEKIGATLSTLG